MDEAIREFKRYLNRRYPGSSTVKHYIHDLQLFQRFVDKAPRAVTRLDIDNFVEAQLARSLSATTVNRRLASLHHFFEFVADEADDDTWANPVVWQRHRVKEGQPLPRDISDVDVERLFGCINSPRDRLMFGLMCWAGLRVGEVAALRVSDLIPTSHLEGVRLRVRGKGQKERVVPLTPALVQQWEAWLAQRPQVESDVLFITRRRRGISERGIQDRLAHYCRQAGIQVSCHQLRHTFGRRMTEVKMPLTSLSKMMGHAQVTTTQLYIAGAGVDVRADYEAAMGRLGAERPGSPLFPAAPLQPTGIPPSIPPSPDAGEDGAGVTRPATTEESVDVSRFWAGLPAWLTEPLADYIARQQRRWKPSQVRHHTGTRLQTLRQIWCWLLEERDVNGFAALSRRDVEAYVEARLRAGIAASTINRQLRDLWAFLRFVKEQDQPVSPGIFRIARLKEGRSLPRFLDDQEYHRLERLTLTKTAAGTRDDRLDRAWFYLLAHEGLRLSELCDLRLGDLDLVGQRVAVREGKGKRDRIVPLSATTITALHDYLTVRDTPQTDHLLIFRQRVIKPSLVQNRLRRYGKAVDVKVSPHRLRHTLATRLLNAGMDIVSIQRLLGHEKLETTMIYAHVHDTTVERDFRQAMASLEAGRERRPIAAQTESILLVEELFSHTGEPVSLATQALDRV